MKDLPELSDDLTTLKAVIKDLLARIAELEAENAELKQRLGLTSHNSHKPPSSDGLSKATTKPGLPKKAKGKNGGQEGHQGKTLMRSETPDILQRHLPHRCECCQRPIADDEACTLIATRQVFDLPKPRLVITEHQLGQIECCGRLQVGSYPDYVTAPVQYGAGVKALVTLLSVNHYLSLERVNELFQDLFDYSINEQTVLSFLERGYQQAEPCIEFIKQEIRVADTLHVDESGVRVSGALHWAHVASTEHYTCLEVYSKRGLLALAAPGWVLNDYRGLLVHDCWAPYFSFNNVTHALCGSHLLRELNNLIDNGSQWAGVMHHLLLTLHDSQRPMISIAHESVRQRYRFILQQADHEEPPPTAGKRGRPKKSKGRNLYERFKNFEEEILRFAFEFGVPFTNNQAERDLRTIKVKLKVCGCFRTLLGARVYARLESVIATCRKQKQSAFDWLHALFLAAPVKFGMA